MTTDKPPTAPKPRGPVGCIIALLSAILFLGFGCFVLSWSNVRDRIAQQDGERFMQKLQSAGANPISMDCKKRPKLIAPHNFNILCCVQLSRGDTDRVTSSLHLKSVDAPTPDGPQDYFADAQWNPVPPDSSAANFSFTTYDEQACFWRFENLSP